MKASLQILVITLILFAGSTAAYGQSEPLNIFGYFQTNYLDSRMEIEMFGQEIDRQTRSFSLQQANLFLNKNFSPQMNAFVNFELTNSFSSARDWGSFSLEEAWAQYRASDLLQIKGGMLIPTFNNLNEVKNRTPLLPYILRPLVYEATYAEYFDMGDFIPERAFVQVSGTMPVGAAQAEYAVHVGNSEYSLLATRAEGGSGLDTTRYKAVGGRVGLRYRAVKAGVSATYDRDNVARSSVPAFRALGTVPRTRLGADLSLAYAGFTVEGELIRVVHDEDVADLSMDKLFYYGSLQYDFTDQVFGYVAYSSLAAKNAEGSGFGLPPFPEVKLSTYTAGAGFRPTFNVVLKAQYEHFALDANEFPVALGNHSVAAALSVLF